MLSGFSPLYGFCPGSTRPAPRPDVELRRGRDDAQHLLGPFGYLCLYALRLPEETGEPLISGGLGIHGVMVARVGALEGVVEDADGGCSVRHGSPWHVRCNPACVVLLSNPLVRRAIAFHR